MRALVALLILCVFACAARAQTIPRWVQATQDYLGGVYIPDRLFIYRAGPFEDGPTLRVQREITEGSGQPWNTYKAIWALGATNPENRGFEWTITGEMHNRALGSGGAQNVAVNGTIWKVPSTGPVGPSWALNGNCVDLTGESPPTYSCIGLELDVSSSAGGPDPNRQRVGLHVAGGGQAGEHIGYGMMVSPGPGAVIDRAIALHPGGGTYGIGLDTSQATFTVAPIVLGDNQSIVLDGSPEGPGKHGIAFAGGDFMFWGLGGAVFKVNDRGRFASGYSVEFAPEVPSHPGAPCEVGQHAWDQNFDYRCVRRNTWKRAALSDW